MLRGIGAPSSPRGKHLTLEKKMAYSLLFSERPQVAGVASINPLRALARWVADMRTRRAQRIALSSLLDLDAALLADMGISRHDVLEALRCPSMQAGQQLAARRAMASAAWLTHP